MYLQAQQEILFPWKPDKLYPCFPCSPTSILHTASHVSTAYLGNILHSTWFQSFRIEESWDQESFFLLLGEWLSVDKWSLMWQLSLSITRALCRGSWIWGLAWVLGSWMHQQKSLGSIYIFFYNLKILINMSKSLNNSKPSHI